MYTLVYAKKFMQKKKVSVLLVIIIFLIQIEHKLNPNFCFSRTAGRTQARSEAISQCVYLEQSVNCCVAMFKQHKSHALKCRNYFTTENVAILSENSQVPASVDNLTTVHS